MKQSFAEVTIYISVFIPGSTAPIAEIFIYIIPYFV